MEKIEFLLDKLDNRITSSLAKRLDTLDDLQEKLEASGEDYEKNPTDDNRKNYNDGSRSPIVQNVIFCNFDIFILVN